jgi:hypothetical protein
MDEPTCGKGLAENASLPKKLAQLMAAMAETLEVHMTALDKTDENGAREHAAYASLAAQHRDLAAHLAALSSEMAGYRDLPMASHDEQVMTSQAPLEAFEKVVKAEEDLVEMLQVRLHGHREMLASWKEA